MRLYLLFLLALRSLHCFYGQHLVGPALSGQCESQEPCLTGVASLTEETMRDFRPLKVSAHWLQQPGNIPENTAS